MEDPLPAGDHELRYRPLLQREVLLPEVRGGAAEALVADPGALGDEELAVGILEASVVDPPGVAMGRR